MEPGLEASGVFVPPAPTFPNGTHVCEIEIDPETGRLEIVRYCVVDDVGTVINPLLLEGQIHGGVVQGAGQVLLEQIVFDRSSGQLMTGSFMDYAMPRASDFPSINVESKPVPTAVNPLGVKGAGEAGAVGALACVMNGALDALRPFGVLTLEMPATSERIWRAIRLAREPSKAHGC
jgi:carbon-monoxide dehydrogenase large subunit